MVKAAKAPAKKTSPLVWVGLLALCAVAYMTLGGGDGTPAATTRPKTRKVSSKDMGAITQADLDAQKHPFSPVAVAAVDAFNPLIKKQIKVLLPTAKLANETPGMVPVALTGGEANWYYTGCPELNGQKQALLENTATGESIYVRPGEGFKGSRVASIDVSTVVLVGSDGKGVDVPIQAYGDVPGGGKTTLASNAPMVLPGVALSGAIGAGRPGAIGIQPASGPQTITLSNGQTLQLPATDAAVDANADNSNPGGRRRGRRRNRNQNSGDPNNGL